MNYREIKNATKRQFDEVLRKEGFSVTDFYTNAVYKVFFRRVEHNESTVSKMRIYYAVDTNIQRGTMLVFKGETFVVINKDSFESEVYCTSTIVRCNTPFVVQTKSIPFVINTPRLSTMGSSIQQISGNITAFTGDSTSARKMQVNDSYIFGGRTWDVKNTIYIDGLFYALLEMTLNGNDPHIAWIGSYQLDKAVSTTVSNRFVAMNGSAVDPEAVMTYSSSDPSVATIDADGTIHLISTGNVSFTAVWAEHHLSATAEVEVIDSGASPEQRFTCQITYNGLSNVQKIGGSFKIYTATFYDYGGQQAAFQPNGVWSILLKTSSGTYAEHNELLTIEAVSENQIQIQIPSNSQSDRFIGGNMKVTYTAPSGVSGTVVMDLMAL